MWAVITEVVWVIGAVTQSPTAAMMATVPVRSPVSGTAEGAVALAVSKIDADLTREALLRRALARSRLEQ
jgi:hypothetical protein